MRRLLQYLLFALLFLCCLSLTACAKDAPLAEPPAPVEEEPAISEPAFDDSGLVWRVEPTLEYDKIYYCAYHDVFNRNNQEGGALDPKTGLFTGEYYCGHGIGGTEYLYDDKKNIYGIYSGDDAGSYLELLSPDEFFNDPNRRNRLLAVEKIDSALIAAYEGVESYGLGDAHTGIFAIMYGSEFVSDFIYGYDTWNDGVNRDNIIAVRLDDKMGVLDTNGNTVIPFMFEDIVFIDAETAFAKINGKYGILELPTIADNSTAAESPATYITTDNVNLREGPGTDSARIMTVPQGTAVEVLDILDGEWYLVEYEGQQGYMKAEFLAEAADIAEESPDYITIKGEQYSTSLTMLDLSDMNLSNKDILPLRYMANLSILHMGGNQISDLSPLSGLTKLNYLRLYDNQISNLSPLANLKNLTGIIISGNQISDLTPLSGLTKLTDLELGNNKISNLSPLASLVNLINLNVYKNQISNLTPLSGLTNLTMLDAYSNQITDLKPLSVLPNLTILICSANQISDLTPLSSLTNMFRIHLGGNQISDASPLAALTNLYALGLENNQLTDISFLSSMASLAQLDLYNNQISDLSPLFGLTDLFDLRLQNNQISDLSPLAGLIKLTRLDLSNNRITDITPLSTLTKLGDLKLEDNQISDWSPVEYLPNVYGRQ